MDSPLLRAFLSQQAAVLSWVFFRRGIQINRAPKSRRRPRLFYCDHVPLFQALLLFFRVREMRIRYFPADASLSILLLIHRAPEGKVNTLRGGSIDYST